MQNPSSESWSIQYSLLNPALLSNSPLIKFTNFPFSSEKRVKFFILSLFLSFPDSKFLFDDNFVPSFDVPDLRESRHLAPGQAPLRRRPSSSSSSGGHLSRQSRQVNNNNGNGSPAAPSRIVAARLAKTHKDVSYSDSGEITVCTM